MLRTEKGRSPGGFLFLLAFAFSCFALFLNYRGRMDGSDRILDRLSSAVEAALDVYGRMVEMVFDGTAPAGSPGSVPPRPA